MLNFLLAVLVAICGQFVLPYDIWAYCKQKWGLKAVYDQQYESNASAVYPLDNTYQFCGGECPGIGSKLPDPKSLRQWVDPLIQFILPAIIFSLSVPRRKEIKFDNIFDFSRIDRLSTNGRYQWFYSFIRLAVSLTMSMIILNPIIIDTILWIAMILVCAGNMLVAGLYEAHLDYRIVQRVQGTNISLEDRTELLLTGVSGSLIIDPKFKSPKAEILESLSTSKIHSECNEQRKFRLLAMVNSQDSFGAAFGAPALFYLGAFVSIIVDLKSDSSNLGSATSLAFGVELVIIVHVAIVSGCLLASKNPSTSAGIVGHNPYPKPLPHCASTIPIMKLSNGSFSIKQIKVTEKISKQFPLQYVEEEKTSFLKRTLLDPAKMLFGWTNAYPTKFQPVWMWDRGNNKMEWIKTTQEWTKHDGEFKNSMKFTAWGWFLKISLPALILVLFPPLAATVVTYSTPPIGLNCRCLTFLVYAICQLAITFLSTVKNALQNQTELDCQHVGILQGWKYWALSSFFPSGSSLAIIGGTVLQLSHFFTTGLCYTSLYQLGDYDDAPGIDDAAEMQDDRDSSRIWHTMVISAASFMVFTLYFGWWYQRLIRKRFILTVENIYRYGNDGNKSDTKIEIMEPSNCRVVDAPLLPVIGDGSPLEEEDHEESMFDTMTPVKVLTPISAGNTFTSSKC